MSVFRANIEEFQLWAQEEHDTLIEVISSIFYRLDVPGISVPEFIMRKVLGEMDVHLILRNG